jgi:hypothetical protein
MQQCAAIHPSEDPSYAMRRHPPLLGWVDGGALLHELVCNGGEVIGPAGGVQHKRSKVAGLHEGIK